MRKRDSLNWRLTRVGPHSEKLMHLCLNINSRNFRFFRNLSATLWRVNVQFFPMIIIWGLVCSKKLKSNYQLTSLLTRFVNYHFKNLISNSLMSFKYFKWYWTRIIHHKYLIFFLFRCIYLVSQSKKELLKECHDFQRRKKNLSWISFLSRVAFFVIWKN